MSFLLLCLLSLTRAITTHFSCLKLKVLNLSRSRQHTHTCEQLNLDKQRFWWFQRAGKTGKLSDPTCYSFILHYIMVSSESWWLKHCFGVTKRFCEQCFIVHVWYVFPHTVGFCWRHFLVVVLECLCGHTETWSDLWLVWLQRSRSSGQGWPMWRPGRWPSWRRCCMTSSR